QQKVVYQLSNNDPFIHKSLIGQLFSLLDALDGITIEVVTHGYGIDFLLKDSPFTTMIEALGEKGVVFMVCRNTLDEGKTEATDVMGLVKIIPAGVAHVVIRQSEGWSYIKAGF
ncbi:MAG: DsrE family protein, partial [Cyclobacteriaceae bacterium]